MEVYKNGFWGTVCDDSWDQLDAQVVCRQLGYNDGGDARDRAYFGQGSGPIWLDNMNCAGTESSLSDCNFVDWGTHNCGHNEDAGVVCYGEQAEQAGMGNGTQGGAHWADDPCLEGFEVRSGRCQVCGNCVTSPNYPNGYHNQDSCEIGVHTSSSITLTVTEFNVESCCDELRISGVSAAQTASSLAGRVLTANDVLTWSTDSSVSDSGWRICAGSDLGVQTCEGEGSCFTNSSSSSTTTIIEGGGLVVIVVLLGLLGGGALFVRRVCCSAKKPQRQPTPAPQSSSGGRGAGVTRMASRRLPTLSGAAASLSEQSAGRLGSARRPPSAAPPAAAVEMRTMYQPQPQPQPMPQAMPSATPMPTVVAGSYVVDPSAVGPVVVAGGPSMGGAMASPVVSGAAVAGASQPMPMATAMAIPMTQSPTEAPPPMGLPVCGGDAPPSYPANAALPVATAMAMPAENVPSAYPAYPACPAAAVPQDGAPPAYPACPGASDAPPAYPAYPTAYPGDAASSSGAGGLGDLPPGLSQKVSSACLSMADRTKHRGSCMTSGI